MADKIAFGLAIVAVNEEGPEFYCAGKTASEGGVDIDKTTIFRLGSATKGFTEILLADLMLRDRVLLNDPVN